MFLLGTLKILNQIQTRISKLYRNYFFLFDGGFSCSSIKAGRSLLVTLMSVSISRADLLDVLADERLEGIREKFFIL